MFLWARRSIDVHGDLAWRLSGIIWPCWYVSRILSPTIVRAILDRRINPVELTPTRLVALSRNLPHDWQEQRRLLGFAPD